MNDLSGDGPVDLEPVPTRLLTLLHRNAPLTVIRGPRGFGKSALARARVESVHPTQATAVHVLPPSTPGAGQWWQSVNAQAIASGAVGPADERQASTAAADVLRDRLSRTRRPVVLVLERIDLIGDTGVEQQILDLVDSCPQVDVVVTLSGRSMFRDGIVLDPPIVRIGSEILLHTVDDLRELAEKAGTRPNPGELEFIHRCTGGLPSLTSVALDAAMCLPQLPRRRRILEHHIEEAIAAHVSSVLLDTPEASEHHGFLVDMSTAHTLTADVAEFLGGGDTARERLGTLESLGLVDYSENTGTWSFPSAVRRVLLARQPSRGLNQQSRLAALAQHHLEREDYGTALQYATEAEQWTLVAALAEEHLPDLAGPHLTLLAAALRALPARLLDNRPSLGAVRSLLADLDGTPPTDVVSGSEAPAVLDDAAAVIRTTHRSIRIRLAGDYTAAAGLTDHLRTAATSLMASRPDDLSEYLPFLRMQWGLTYQMAGHFAESNAEFRSAHQLGAERKQDYIVRNAAANSALNWAMAGDAHRVHEWLSLAHATGTADDWAEALVGIGGFLAHALISLDRLDIPEAGAALDRLDRLPPVVELWPFVTYTRRRHGILSGRADPSSALLSDHAAHGRTGGTFVDSLLDTVEIETHLALGNGVRARALADTLACVYPWETAAVARAHLLTGSYSLAAGICHRYDWHGGPYIRFHLDALVIESAAHHALGNADEAAAKWQRACVIAERTGIRSSFTGISRESALEIDSAAGTPSPAVSAVLAGHSTQSYPTGLHFPDLTERELSVLGGLAQGLTAGEIAASLYLSASTVKSHRRTLYKKLNVHTRSEAVAAAGELGILDAAFTSMSTNLPHRDTAPRA